MEVCRSASGWPGGTLKQDPEVRLGITYYGQTVDPAERTVLTALRRHSPGARISRRTPAQHAAAAAAVGGTSSIIISSTRQAKTGQETNGGRGYRMTIVGRSPPPPPPAARESQAGMLASDLLARDDAGAVWWTGG